MKKLLWLLVSTFIGGNEYYLETPIMMEGIKQSILDHIIHRQNKKYKKSVFHKYMRLYTVQNKSNFPDKKKIYAFAPVKRDLLTDFENHCINHKKYFIFTTKPLEGLRAIICVVFVEDASSTALNTLKIKINKKIVGKELKLLNADKESFERKHYLECFDTFTQADRDAAWQATEKTRKGLSSMQFKYQY